AGGAVVLQGGRDLRRALAPGVEVRAVPGPAAARPVRQGGQKRPDRPRVVELPRPRPGPVLEGVTFQRGSAEKSTLSDRRDSPLARGAFLSGAAFFSTAPGPTYTRSAVTVSCSAPPPINSPCPWAVASTTSAWWL